MVNSRLCEMARLASFSVRLRLLEFLNCETKLRLWNGFAKKIETARHTEPLKKRDYKTREIWLKFCKTCNFWKTIWRPIWSISQSLCYVLWAELGLNVSHSSRWLALIFLIFLSSRQFYFNLGTSSSPWWPVFFFTFCDIIIWLFNTSINISIIIKTECNIFFTVESR